jgi:hypothetical protein
VAIIDVFTRGPEQPKAYNQVEKLRDPSHVRALSLEELPGLGHDAGLRVLKVAFFKMEMALAALLAASFPGPGDADRIRQAFADDVGLDRLGVGARRRDGAVHFAFPIVVIVGHKQEAQAASTCMPAYLDVGVKCVLKGRCKSVRSRRRTRRS